MKLKQILAMVLISAVTTLVTLAGYRKFTTDDTYLYKNGSNDSGKIPVNYAGFNGVTGVNASIDFVPAASAAIPATVHIKTKTNRTASNNLPKRSPFGDMFDLDLDDFFGDRLRSLPQMASGSGAIISEDGYIVTNNHVIDGADEINVTLSNKRSFKAKLIGADPSSDIAVLKIEAK
jgi:serine protease Do